LKLIKKMVSIDTFISYAEENNTEKLKEVIKENKNYDINQVGSHGLTALIWASTEGCCEAVSYLLSLKTIEVNKEDEDGNSALQAASLNGHGDVVKILLTSKDIDVNCRDPENSTPLHDAAAQGHHQIVKLLLDAGSDISIRNSSGKTAREMAADSNTIKTFVKRTPKTPAESSKGKSFGKMFRNFVGIGRSHNESKSKSKWGEPKATLESISTDEDKMVEDEKTNESNVVSPLNVSDEDENLNIPQTIEEQLRSMVVDGKSYEDSSPKIFTTPPANEPSISPSEPVPIPLHRQYSPRKRRYSMPLSPRKSPHQFRRMIEQNKATKTQSSPKKPSPLKLSCSSPSIFERSSNTPKSPDTNPPPISNSLPNELSVASPKLSLSKIMSKPRQPTSKTPDEEESIIDSLKKFRFGESNNSSENGLEGRVSSLETTVEKLSQDNSNLLQSMELLTAQVECLRAERRAELLARDKEALIQQNKTLKEELASLRQQLKPTHK